MKKKFLQVLYILMVSALLLQACNLPRQQPVISPTNPVYPQQNNPPTPASLCANLFFPSSVGDEWAYSGTNSLVGAYTRTDTITATGADSFTQSITQGDVVYTAPYDCTSTGITSRNPVEQYAGALLSSPNTPVNVKLTSNGGTSLPVAIKPGDTWQQTADWEATSQQINLNGRFVFDYTAVGYENVSVPAGTYNALHINGTIRVELTSLHIPTGTYSLSTWWAPDVGLIKSEGTSHVTGVDFSDSMQLTKFTPAP